MILAVALGLTVINIFDSPDKNKPTQKEKVTPVADVADSFEAYLICKKFVSDRLHAPKTAEFASYDQSKVHDLGSSEFDVIGYVDAQNKLGALVRERYLCKVRYVGDRNWHLIHLHFKQ